MEPEDWLFRNRLMKLIKARIDMDVTDICAGQCTPDDYKFRSGRLSAFNEIMATAQDLIDIMTGKTEEI